MQNIFEVDKFASEWRKRLKTHNMEDCELHAEKIAKKIKDSLKKKFIECSQDINQTSNRLYADLTKHGIVDLGLMLSKKQVGEILSHLNKQQVYNAHVYAQSDKMGRSLDDPVGTFASYRMADIIPAPHIIELANHPELITLAEQFLGCVPTIYSINCWWSFPAKQVQMRNTQSFHHDIDDFRFLSLFIYLTDVDEECGPHQYVPGSHTVSGLKTLLANSFGLKTSLDRATIMESGSFNTIIKLLINGQSYLTADHFQEIFGNNYNTFTGNQGSGFISTPVGFHRGLTPRKRPRLMLWVRYGLFNNNAVERDLIEPVNLSKHPLGLSVDAKTKYMNRLVFNLY